MRSVTHYMKKANAMGKTACGARPRRSLVLACTMDMAEFQREKAAGTACERCIPAVEKMERIAAKYAARAHVAPHDMLACPSGGCNTCDVNPYDRSP